MVDYPIGTPDERAAARGQHPPGGWVNSNPFCNYYQLAPGVWNYHDGVDLNLNTPNWNDDWHKPVYAMADGFVYFAGVGGGSWGHIICIAHVDPITDKIYYSRYGHVENTIVKSGDDVKQGQQIAQVGNGDGYYGQSGAHLHWNICITDLMEQQPNQWCGTNKNCVLTNYTDPIEFVKERYMVDNPDTGAAMRAALSLLPARTPVTVTPSLPPEREPFGTQLSYVVPVEDVLGTPAPPRATVTKYVKASPSMNVRSTPSTANPPVGTIAYQAAVTVYADQPDPAWYQIALTSPVFQGDYLASQWLSDTRP